MAVTRNSSKTAIKAWQTSLNKAGASLVVDGIWGPKTDAANAKYASEVDDSTTSSDDGLVGTGPEGTEPRFGLAGGAELWKDTTSGESYIMYAVPDTKPPVYMRWTVPSDEDVQSFFGPGQPVVYQQEYAGDDNVWGDTIDFGSSDDIANTSKSPFDSWASTLAVESESKPWILDDDYQQLFAMAMIEGRNLSEGEIMSTNWWKDHSEPQRQWMQMSAGDPATAEQQIATDVTTVTNAMRTAGIENADEGLIGFIATQFTHGNWTEQKLYDQIKRMSDPFYDDQPLDGELQDFLDDNDIQNGRTIDKENEVRDTVKRWLGTNFGDWSDDQVASWAGRVRNDPDAMESLTETLKDQKQALFAGYDREADYQTISSPWKTMIQNMWGEVPNDSDTMLHDVIRMNSAPEASQLLTEEGLNRGNDLVVNNVQGALDRSFGGL